MATNDTGTETGNYVDLGINSSTFAQAGMIGGINDGYLYTTGSHMFIGNATSGNKNLYFFAGSSTNTSSMTLSSSGNFGIFTTTPAYRLDVSGSTRTTALIGGVKNVSFSATTSIDFDAAMFHTASLTGSTYLTASNLGSGKMASIKMKATGSQNCNLYYPSSWVWLGSTSSYSAVSASKTSVVSLTCFGTTDADICATYITQL